MTVMQKLYGFMAMPVWIYCMAVVVFSKHCILHFRDNAHLLKYYQVKESQNLKKIFTILNKGKKQNNIC